MICYMKCVRCGKFEQWEPREYNAPQSLPKDWSLIAFHKGAPTYVHDSTRVVCTPCTAYFLLLLHDNMPHREP